MLVKKLLPSKQGKPYALFRSCKIDCKLALYKIVAEGGPDASQGKFEQTCVEEEAISKKARRAERERPAARAAVNCPNTSCIWVSVRSIPMIELLLTSETE